MGKYRKSEKVGNLKKQEFRTNKKSEKQKIRKSQKLVRKKSKKVNNMDKLGHC